jgi:CRP-like cAMP-binding protein
LDLVRPHLADVTLRAGQILFEPDEEIAFVYFLHDGAVSKLSAFADGGEVEAAIVGREGAVGATVVLGLSCSVTRDVCHVEARASRLPAERLKQACLSSPRIHRAIDRYAMWKLSSAMRSGACNARHSVGQRLCRWLLACSDVLESDRINLPQEVFANMLGVQRTSINPILQDLKAAGAISIARSCVVITDRDLLMERACECYAAMKRDQNLFSEAQIADAAET